MKRRLLLFVFAAIAGTLTALADDYIKVSNRDMPFNESWSKKCSYFNDSESDGTISWDASTRTLTMHNFEIDRFNDLSWGNSQLTCLEINSRQDVTIELKGRSYLGVGRGKVLALHGNTTFTGDGKLSFWSRDGDKFNIELMEENLNVTVDGPTLEFWYGSKGIRGKNNTGSFHLERGLVKGSVGYLFQGMKSVTFDYGYGVQQPHGAEFSPQQHIMVDPDGNDVKGSAVVLGEIKYYGFSICGVEITENNCDLIDKIVFVKSGDVHYDPSSNTLFLDNATIVNNSNVPTIENASNDGLDIKLKENNIFKFEGEKERWAMSLKENTQIKGKFNDEDFLHVIDADYAGIHVGANKCLRLDGVTLNIPYLKGGNINSELHIDWGVTINATGNDKLGTLSWLRMTNSNYYSLDGFIPYQAAVESTASQPRFIWNRDDNRASGVYENRNEFAKGPVHIETNNDWDCVTICGQRVIALNRDNIVNQYIKSGRIYYDDEGLHLCNVDLDDEGQDDPTLEFKWSKTIFLEGTNKIKCNNIEAIKALRDLTIQNDASGASLIIEGRDARVNTSGTLKLLDTKVTAPEISASELDVYGSWLNVTRKLEADKVSLDTETEMVVSTPEAPAYYDSEEQQIVAPKGPVSIVPKSSVTEYPIFFLGEQVTSANASCIMNKHITSGSLSVKKTSDAYNIVMDNLVVSYDGEYPMFNFTSTDRMNIDVKDWNVFNLMKAGPQAHFITGYSESVNIYADTERENFLGVMGSTTTNAGAILVGNNSSLKFSNRYVNSGGSFNAVLPRIYGMGRTSTLVIQDPYVTLNGNSQGTVNDVNVELPTGRAELDRSNHLFIDNGGIYLDYVIYTGQVKFVGKGESYVPVDDIRLFPPMLMFERKGQTGQLKADVYPEDATNRNVVWVSNDETVAKVDQKGKVTAVGKGQAIIFAYSEDTVFDIENPSTYTNACVVHVIIPDPYDITLSETDVLIDRESVGGFYLTANLTPDNAETDYFEWESSDETLVTVLRNSGKTALVRRVGDEGQATITVKTANGLSASCNVTVHYPITPITVQFAQRTYTLTEVGEQLKLEPIVTPENCEKLSFVWNCYGEAISLSNDGTVTALRNGSAVVECWACYDGQQWAPGEVRINVDIPPTPVIATGLTLSPASSPIFYSLGERLILTPVFTPEDVTSEELTWKSSNENVATVDENGFVTIVGWGDCDITATTTDGSNLKASHTINAIDPSTLPEPVYATGIKLTDNEVTLMRGEEARIGVTIEPANYTESVMVELLEGDLSIAEAREEWDWNTNQTSIYIRSDMMSEQFGDVKYVVRPNAVDWEKLNAMGIWEEPKDTITIHVLAPIIFAEASPEDINITYHVTDINDKTCEVYTQSRPGMPFDPLDPDLVPAVSTTATGKLTVPARANGYWVTNVMPCAFNHCTGLTDIEFSEGIESIGDYACYSALFSLERVTLPSTIKELGYSCFSANPSDYATSEDPSGRNFIREVNIKSFTPPTGQNGNDISMTGAFQSVASDAVLFVPTGALANYNVQPWTEWFSRIEEKAFFEDEDAIREVESSKLKVESSWFDLSGRKLAGKPAKAGLYINGGKKIVVK